MPVSAITELHDVILSAIKQATRGDWKVLVVDEETRKVIDNVVKEDDILKENITSIERIEERRDLEPDTDAVYLLSPTPYVIECLFADFEMGRYRSGHMIWTGLLNPRLRHRLEESANYRPRRVGFDTVLADFFPRESHLVTFRDPWSFPLLYHPQCDGLVAQHLRILAQRITSVCVTLGECPRVRYYKSRQPIHEAHVLCGYLARFVQEELNTYAEFTPGFGEGTGRPASVLVITDRSMDLAAPLLHEFTYQAMAHDLLPGIRDTGDRARFRMVVNEGGPDAEERDMDLHDGDRVWVDNRHRHMRDTIDKIMADFNRFIEANPHFARASAADKTSLNTIKDMLAGLPQFQTQKDAYSLHITMAQECMSAFQRRRLPDVAAAEQTLATGLDEDGRKPSKMLEEVVRLLVDDAVTGRDRLRLIMIYIMYRDGLIPEDIKRLLSHARLPSHDIEAAVNLKLLGARTSRGLKETRVLPPPLFPPAGTGAAAKSAPNGSAILAAAAASAEEDDGSNVLSRYQTVLRLMLEELCRGTLDQGTFPYTIPPADPREDLLAAQSGSLRAGRPNWASTGRKAPENRQRIFVFVAGGATFSESRDCYTVGARHSRDIFLITSHMLTPEFFLRQLADLSLSKRELDLPLERPQPKPPSHLYARPAPPPPPPPPVPAQQQQQHPKPGLPPVGHPPRGGTPVPGRPTPSPPVGGMASLSLGGRHSSDSSTQAAASSTQSSSGHVHEDKKSKRRYFGLKK